jgi:isochorismate synthase
VTEAPALYALTKEIDLQLSAVRPIESLATDAAFFWEEPDSKFRMAGLGSAWEHASKAGGDRMVEASNAARGVFERLERHGDGEGGGPRLVGGFAFSASPEPPAPIGINSWGSFPAAALVLPQVTIESKNDRAWLTVVVSLSSTAGSEARAMLERARGRLSIASDSEDEPAAWSKPAPDPNGEDIFRSLVKQAVAEVESGKLAKVVAARSAQVEGAAEPWRIIDVLRRRYPSCVTYGVFRHGSVFLGASPELLVEVKRGRVTSGALAGTVVRGMDDHADARLEDSLRHDPKELAEHQYVVQGLRRALHEAGVDLDAPTELEIVKLANVQHLASAVTGRAGPGTGILDLVAAVHPTPAVAGLPRRASLEWLAAHESLDRGWYAGPVGFVDANLEGSFRVGLRCALIQDGRARLFAGAGIVAGSLPESELAETTAKLRAMLDAFRGG